MLYEIAYTKHSYAVGWFDFSGDADGLQNHCKVLNIWQMQYAL